MALKKTWIVVADYSHTRIYTIDNRERKMTLLETVSNEVMDKVEGKKERGDVATTATIGYRALVDENSQKRRVGTHYVSKVTDKIEKARAENQFQHLILAASPDLLGQIKGKLENSTLRRIHKSTDKDYARFDERAIRKIFKDDINHSFLPA